MAQLQQHMEHLVLQAYNAFREVMVLQRSIESGRAPVQCRWGRSIVQQHSDMWVLECELTLGPLWQFMNNVTERKKESQMEHNHGTHVHHTLRQ